MFKLKICFVSILVLFQTISLFGQSEQERAEIKKPLESLMAPGTTDHVRSRGVGTALNKMFAGLTPGQRFQFAELKGKEIEFDKKLLRQFGIR